MSKQTSEQVALKSVGQLAECHGEPLPDIHHSMWEMFYSTATRYPERDAVISLWQLPIPKSQNKQLEKQSDNLSEVDSVLRWSYAELQLRVEHLAGWLQSQDCAEGENLVTFVWNSAEWVLFFWVAVRMKMTFVPLDPRTIEQGVDDYLSRLKPSIIVVQDEAAASTLEKTSSQMLQSKIRICCTESPSSSWASLLNLYLSEIETKPYVEFQSPGQETALIVFTSGTTSTPKGCCHTATNLWSACYDYDPDTDKGIGEKWLVHTPTSHIFAINNCLRAFRYGGTVVFASKTFDIHASLKALELHQCTRMSAIPTLVQGLLSLPKFPGKEKLALNYVTLGGTLIKEEDIQMCKRLGSNSVIQAYGMSEGAPITSWRRDDPLIKSGHYPGVGKALPGCRVRICAPESREVLAKNVAGELHIGGTCVISNYLNDAESDSFYIDEYGSWLRTGDIASMDDNDCLQILGRYKDLIIRGGENISPATIEQCIGHIPGTFPQVVGLVDSTAGEVPVIVVQSLKSTTKLELMSLISHLPQSHTPAAILTLEELGLEGYPLTVAGKVRKNVLRELVHKHLAPPDDNATEESLQASSPLKNDLPLTPPSSNGSRDSEAESLVLIGLEKEPSEIEKTIQQLTEIWSTLVVIVPLKSQSILDFADSITLLRYCDKVWRNVGKKLYIQDFVAFETIEKQAELLQTRADASAEAIAGALAATKLSPKDMARAQNGPPGIADMAHVNGDPQRFLETRGSATKVLENFGLSWDTDVEDIIPIKDSFFAVADGPRPQSFRNRMAFRIGRDKVRNVRKALHKGLSSRPLFRTVLMKMPDMTPLHIVIRPGEQLFSTLITEKMGLNEAAIEEMTTNDSGDSFSRILMFQAIIVYSADSATLILTYNHSVFDAMSMIPWYRDLDILLTDPETPLLQLTPFKLFADMTYSHRDSMPATLDVQYMVQRFSGISKHADAFWPPQRAPGWFIASDQDCEDHETRMKARKGAPIRYPRVVTKTHVPHMTSMKARNILPVIVVKTAIALFNIQQTGQEYAIFHNIDAGRAWPFMPAWIPLPPAMSIDGPTIEWTMNMFRILPDETPGQLLERIRDDQEELSLHAHAPLFRILDGLGSEAPFLVDAFQRQTFNWDISLQYLDGRDDLTTLKSLERVDWPDSGFFWEGGMTGAEELCILASWDDAQLSLEEVEGHVESLNKIVQWVIEPDNWSKPVGEILGAKSK